jgi:peroxiredoxin
MLSLRQLFKPLLDSNEATGFRRHNLAKSREVGLSVTGFSADPPVDDNPVSQEGKLQGPDVIWGRRGSCSMITRYFEAFLAVAFLAMGTHAQTGFFGQVTTGPEAGDLAPEVSIERVLSTPQRTTWNPANLFGPITVLTFLPNICFNLQSVMSWNALIDEFVGKPVQFVCITQERESSLLPFLAEHPMKGFLLLDSGGAVGRSYGLGQPAAVIIGTDGRIIGFDRRLFHQRTH